MTLVRVMNETSRLKKTIPSSRAKWLRLGLAEHPRAVGDVDLAVEHRLHQPRHLRGQVLAVGVEGDDDLGPGVDHQPVAGAQRRAAAAVDHVAGDGGAVLARRRRRCRRASRRRRRAPRSRRRRPRPASGRARGRCCRPRCRRGSGSRSCRGSAPACAGGAELLPGEPLEHAPSSRVIREPCESARRRAGRGSRSRRRRGRGCGCRSRARTRRRTSSASGISVPETIASAERDHAAGSARRRCAASGGARSRSRRSARASDQPAGADRGQLRGQEHSGPADRMSGPTGRPGAIRSATLARSCGS